MVFYKEMTELVEDGRGMGVVYLGFSKVFDTVSRKIFLDNLIK